MDINLIVPAFIAGLLTFLAPCTLPMVPGYLGFISGASFEDLRDPAKARKIRGKIFLNGLFFMIGFSAVFIFLGTLAGLAGQALVPYRLWMAGIGGAFVILFGLVMLGVLNIPVFSGKFVTKTPKIFERGKSVNSFILGSAFGLGWTPCVGPILGTILLLASTTATALNGAFLLFIFSLGLAVPFLAVALGISSASRYIARMAKYLRLISIVGGVLLIILGVALATNNMGLVIAYGYRFLRFINYERLLNYL